MKTREVNYRGVPNMSATKWPKWDLYDWDVKPSVDTDMTETPRPELEQIWLRRPKKFSSLFFILTQSQLETLKCVKSKCKNKFFFERLSHICANSVRGVSVISVSTLGFASQSYRSHLGHFVALILLMKYDIRHPPIKCNFSQRFY